MKKILALFALIPSFGFCVAQNLPAEATNFISTYYPSNHITQVSDLGSQYHVDLDLNVGISFDANGRWLEIESFEQGIPSTLLTEKQRTYLETNRHNINSIGKIKRSDSTTLIILHDGSGYRFDANSNFIRHDFDE